MKAIVLQDGFIKNLDDLKVSRVELSKTRKTNKAPSAVVSVHAVGLNFFDILSVRGMYQDKPEGFPFIPGSEFSGVITEIIDGEKETVHNQ